MFENFVPVASEKKWLELEHLKEKLITKWKVHNETEVTPENFKEKWKPHPPTFKVWKVKS